MQMSFRSDHVTSYCHDMVSLTPFILSSSSFSCSRSNSKRSTQSSIKSKLSSHIAGRGSCTTYLANNTSREQLLVPSDLSLVEPVQSYRQEPRRLSLGKHWYFLNHSKSAKPEEAISPRKAFEGYYLLAAASRPAQSTETSPRDRKRNSASMASNFPSSVDGNTNNLGGESFESATTNTPNEQRRSYGIGGAGNIRKPSEVIYAAREKRRSSVLSSPSVPPSTSPDTKRGSFLSWFGIGSGTKDEK
ncbi:hypothetical protein DSL72_003294 [Monilinia vaccinii-corymbosi]|uniref:Uncharacterized protein n=1 Tax=Monilinia vaccinii-corymbosi TaxID=61207 RepID=A0A8A3P7S2_9HELO|nr:hypothetical protein DSL72_003294 [Monilinia vaccinii-corymbosi]